MSLFSEIVQEALMLNEEFAGEDNIVKAIRNMLRVRLTYSDKIGPKGKKERYILPVAFGKTKRGNKAVRAYETFGSTKRGLRKTAETPKGNPWKLFLLDNIVSWTNGNRSFKELKDALISSGFNVAGDKGMSVIYEISPLANTDVAVATDDKPIDSEPITAADIANTPALQQPTVAKSKNFTTSAEKQGKTIDKTAQKPYIKDKLTAPSTKPIEKNDIEPEANRTAQPKQEPSTEIGNEPITKQDIKPEAEPETKPDIQDNPITNTYKDLMARMDKLNNNEEEEDNEERWA